jgi:hypothetical protein
MDILKVMDRIKALQEFEVKTTLPEGFRFNGTIPFDMHIVGEDVTIKVLAATLDEAMLRVDSFLFGVDNEDN